jgi:predicted nucleotidyltransferase
LTTEDPELAGRFDRVLADTVEAMEEAGIRYAFIGGIASGGLGRPRSTHDIDLFVLPEEAEVVLRALARHGFRTEKTDPSWLYKGFKEGILVDVIFKSKGDIYLDSEMYQRSITAEYHGRRLKLVAPEDLLIIKAAAHSELTPGHWHDATALLSHANLDWEYLIKRARRAPRRILSLLLYAQSNDIGVPNYVIHELYATIFGDISRHHIARPTPIREERVKASQPPQQAWPSGMTRGAPGGPKYPYAAAHLREVLAEDLRTNELDIIIEQSDDKILLRGVVSVPERREAIEQIAREKFPDFVVENQIQVIRLVEPTGTEEMP